MSFQRLIFYHAMLGGWAAFVGWFLSELLFLRRDPNPDFGWNILAAAMVGAAIGGGIALVGAVVNGRLGVSELMRLGFGLGGGFLGGALGGLFGSLLYREAQYLIMQALGWMIMGLGIGGIDGLFDRSSKKIRNGLIGGALGGFLGGLCLVPAASMAGGDMSARAIAFVILGSCIGLFIGLAQIILREAWLTVEQGFRPGRQFVLNVPVTILGTSEKSQLPFIAFGAKGVEPVHVRIEQQSDGTFVLFDNGTRTGTFLNGKQVREEVLHNDDVIQLGPNVVRFREAVRHVTNDGAAQTVRPRPAATPAPAELPEAVPYVPPAPTRSASRPQPPTVPAAPPVAKSPSVGPIAPRPMPPVAPTPRSTPAPFSPPNRPTPGVAPRARPCPKCGRPGTPIPGSEQHLCMSCDLKY